MAPFENEIRILSSQDNVQLLSIGKIIELCSGCCMCLSNGDVTYHMEKSRIENRRKKLNPDGNYIYFQKVPM